MNLIKENNNTKKILINHLSDFNLSQLKNSEIKFVIDQSASVVAKSEILMCAREKSNITKGAFLWT